MNFPSSRISSEIVFLWNFNLLRTALRLGLKSIRSIFNQMVSDYETNKTYLNGHWKITIVHYLFSSNLKQHNCNEKEKQQCYNITVILIPSIRTYENFEKKNNGYLNAQLSIFKKKRKKSEMKRKRKTTTATNMYIWELAMVKRRTYLL